MEEIKLMVIGVVLMIQAVCDIRWKKIPLIVTGVGGVLGMVFVCINQSSFTAVLSGLFPGCLCLLFASMSREAMGYGDALLLCSMGLFYELKEMTCLLFMAFGFAGITALFLIVIFKKTRTYEMAFVPFLAAAYVLDIWIRMERGYW